MIRDRVRILYLLFLWLKYIHAHSLLQETGKQPMQKFVNHIPLPASVTFYLLNILSFHKLQ